MESLLHELDTGDVLLYRTNDIGATFNACVQRATWSHVGIVVKASPMLQQLYSHDYADEHAGTSSTREELAVFEAVPRRGVSLFPLDMRLARTVDSLQLVAVRRLSKDRNFSSAQQENLNRFIKEV
jgi:cell wall-associated NlpC family hydrolase